ncbi:hypothetical protein M3J09_008045 [Ascochyta lentis]
MFMYMYMYVMNTHLGTWSCVVGGGVRLGLLDWQVRRKHKKGSGRLGVDSLDPELCAAVELSGGERDGAFGRGKWASVLLCCGGEVACLFMAGMCCWCGGGWVSCEVL